MFGLIGAPFRGLAALSSALGLCGRYEYHLWQFENILRNTQLEYIDLLLIHWPGDAHVDPKKTNMSCAEGHPQAGDHKGYSLCRKEAWKVLHPLAIPARPHA